MIKNMRIEIPPSTLNFEMAIKNSEFGWANNEWIE
jgi:hypothetical protein